MELLIAAGTVAVFVLILVQGVVYHYLNTIRLNRSLHRAGRRQRNAFLLSYLCQKAGLEDQRETELRRQRQRLARDLHDSVGSKLTYLIHSLDLMTLDITRNGSVASRKQVEDLSQCTRETMQILRETVWVMHQPALTVQQFVDHLRDYLNKYLGIWNHLSHQVNTEGDLAVHLSSEQALNLFRIVQEAVTNVLRHAQASSLCLRIVSSSTDGLRLEILDDGRGFNPAENRQGVGLDSLRQRTYELGGDFTIRSSQQDFQNLERETPVLPLPIIPKNGTYWRTAILVRVPFEVENTANAV